MCADFTPSMSKSLKIWDPFFPILFPNDFESLKCLNIGLWKGGAKRRLNGVNKWKKSVKNIFAAAILDHIWVKMFNRETTFSITFPQGFRISKKYGLQEVGEKRPLNGAEKVWWINKHTYISTQNKERIGPEGQLFKHLYIYLILRCH